MYDVGGYDAATGKGGAGFTGFPGGMGGMGGININDLFKEMMGGSGGSGMRFSTSGGGDNGFGSFGEGFPGGFFTSGGNGNGQGNSPF